jgi:hypothetical protein
MPSLFSSRLDVATLLLSDLSMYPKGFDSLPGTLWSRL